MVYNNYIKMDKGGTLMNEVPKLAKETGRSRVTIYRVMKQLREQGIERLPTKEEILNRKNGRPKKYKY